MIVGPLHRFTAHSNTNHSDSALPPQALVLDDISNSVSTDVGAVENAKPRIPDYPSLARRKKVDPERERVSFSAPIF
jgi:hypothetical protein